MKYIPDSVVLRQSPTTTREILRSPSRQGQKRKCRDMYQAFRKPASDANKNAFLFFKGSFIQSLQKRIHHPRHKRRQKKNKRQQQQQQQNTTFH